MYCLLFARCVAAGLYPLFHEHIFQVLAVWNPVYKQSTLCVTFPFPWDCQVLVWHHCHHVLSSSSTRQSRPLPFFPRTCTFSMVMTIACCPCHVVRVTSTLALGKVAKNCQAVAAGAFMLFGYALWVFFKTRVLSFFLTVLLSCPRVVCSMFPVL